jgi:hypothetical protein
MSVYRLDRWLIRVSGPDRVSFLNNLLTQNVEELEGVRYGALLNPQGKVIADMLIWAVGESIVLETDLRYGEDLLRRLSLYKLRAQVTIEGAHELDVLFFEAPFDGAPADPRRPDGSIGYRKLVSREESKDVHEREVAYSRFALEAGVPELAENTQPEELFAGEALLDELNGVDFQKGCFVGQENVSRMKRRATTRRKLCRITYDGERIESGTPVLAGEAEIGSVRATASMLGFALLRLDRALEAAEKGVPLSAGGREIKLFPPSWLTLPSREDG